MPYLIFSTVLRYAYGICILFELNLVVVVSCCFSGTPGCARWLRTFVYSLLCCFSVPMLRPPPSASHITMFMAEVM